jgi:hypothetical protein
MTVCAINPGSSETETEYGIHSQTRNKNTDFFSGVKIEIKNSNEIKDLNHKNNINFPVHANTIKYTQIVT